MYIYNTFTLYPIFICIYIYTFTSKNVDLHLSIYFDVCERSFVTESLLHQSLVALSLALNVLAVLRSGQAAFWDACQEPVAILPKSSAKIGAMSGRMA